MQPSAGHRTAFLDSIFHFQTVTCWFTCGVLGLLASSSYLLREVQTGTWCHHLPLFPRWESGLPPGGSRYPSPPPCRRPKQQVRLVRLLGSEPSRTSSGRRVFLTPASPRACIIQASGDREPPWHSPARYLHTLLNSLFPQNCPSLKAAKQTQTTMVLQPFLTSGMMFWYKSVGRSANRDLKMNSPQAKVRRVHLCCKQTSVSLVELVQLMSETFTWAKASWRPTVGH